MQAAIIGDGAMGTLSSILFDARGIPARMWSAFEEHVEAMRRDGENRRFFPGFPLPENLAVSTDAAEVTNGADLVVIAVPTRYLRRVMEQVRDAAPGGPGDVASGQGPIYVSVVKGIERETLLRPSEVIRDVLGDRRLAVLSGPSLSREVASQLPATVAVASEDLSVATVVQQAYATPWFRLYTSDDPVGVELGGALKNIIAIAAGICDGLELGSNAKAALVTRGLVEMTRLGVAMGAQGRTFAGLAGLGDLVTTCVSGLSRNHHVGEEIGRGRSLDEILEAMGGQCAEGVDTVRSALALADRQEVEMPITQEVYEVLFRGKPPPDALVDLMSRRPKQELPPVEV